MRLKILKAVLCLIILFSNTNMSIARNSCTIVFFLLLMKKVDVRNRLQVWPLILSKFEGISSLLLSLKHQKSYCLLMILRRVVVNSFVQTPLISEAESDKKNHLPKMISISYK